MVSLPPLWIPDELDSVIEALGAVADERTLPVLLLRIGDESEYIWYDPDQELAGKAIIAISERVGSRSFPHLLKACSGPARRALVSIEALCRLRHPDAFPILKKRWKEFEVITGRRSAPLLELMKLLGDVQSVEFCLSFVVSDHRDELEALADLLALLLKLHASVLPARTLNTMCSIPDCVGPRWSAKEDGTHAPDAQEGMLVRRRDWKVGFDSVREAASNELSRRGLRSPDPPPEFRRAMY